MADVDVRGGHRRPRPNPLMPANVEPATRHPDAAAPGTPVPVHNPRCYGCGPEHPAGLRLETVIGEGVTVVGALAVTDQHEGARGLAHGGLLAAAVDEVLGALGWLLLTPMVTGRLLTEYLHPVPVGTSLRIEGRIDGMAGRQVFASAEVLDEQGRVVMLASAVFVMVPLEHFRRHGRPSSSERPADDAAAAAVDISP